MKQKLCCGYFVVRKRQHLRFRVMV